jgi:hypothetical protein
MEDPCKRWYWLSGSSLFFTVPGINKVWQCIGALLIFIVEKKQSMSYKGNPFAGEFHETYPKIFEKRATGAVQPGC